MVCITRSIQEEGLMVFGGAGQTGPPSCSDGLRYTWQYSSLLCYYNLAKQIYDIMIFTEQF